MNGKITRRRDQGGAGAPQEQGGFWSPFQQLNRLRHEIDRFIGVPLEEFIPPAATSLFEGWTPSVDLYDDKEKFVIRADLPGMKKEDIEVVAEGNTLTISGEKRREEEMNTNKDTYRAERFFGRFQRSVTLPTGIDPMKVQAQYKNGVLTLTVPKSEEAKRKQIEVQVG